MSIHLEASISAAPDRVYAALTDSKQFSAITERPAEIGGGEGAAFSLFGGMIVGRHVELAPGERVVQAWRVKAWPPGAYTIVCFELQKEGTGTKLVIDHAGYPDSLQDHLKAGWIQNYIEPLKKHFG